MSQAKSCPSRAFSKIKQGGLTISLDVVGANSAARRRRARAAPAGPLARTGVWRARRAFGDGRVCPRMRERATRLLGLTSRAPVECGWTSMLICPDPSRSGRGNGDHAVAGDHRRKAEAVGRVSLRAGRWLGFVADVCGPPTPSFTVSGPASPGLLAFVQSVCRSCGRITPLGKRSLGSRPAGLGTRNAPGSGDPRCRLGQPPPQRRPDFLR